MPMPIRLFQRSCAALLATALFMPALAHAGGGWDWGWGSPRYHGYYGGYYGNAGHRGHGGGDGWWVAGALALAGAGLVLANNAERDRSSAYVNPSYYGNAVTYDSPPIDGYAPASAPPAAGAAPRVANADPAPRSRAECQRAAVNHSGYDPAAASQWTTTASVQSYQQALQTCLAG